VSIGQRDAVGGRSRFLGKEDRSDFCCGSEPLDRCFKTRVGQDVRRRVSV
jgi:hypothetical protein